MDCIESCFNTVIILASDEAVIHKWKPSSSCEKIIIMRFSLGEKKKHTQMHPYTFQCWLNVNIVTGYELCQATCAL